MRHLGGVLLTVILVVPLVASPGQAGVRQRDFDGATEDTSIFYAILSRTVDHTVTLLENASQSDAGASPKEAENLRTVLGAFDEDIVNIVGASGSRPSQLSEFQSHQEALDRPIRQILEAHETLHSNSSVLTEERPLNTDAETLSSLLGTTQKEREALLELRYQAAKLGEFGLNSTPLSESITARTEQLDKLDNRLYRRLAELQLPAVLTLEPNRGTVRLGSKLIISGVALSGGNPAADSVVKVELGGLSKWANVDTNGTYRTRIEVPALFDPGPYNLRVSGQINETNVEAGPQPIEIEPVQTKLFVQPSTTALADRSPLKINGSLSTDPITPGNRSVILSIDDRQFAEVTTTQNGSFGAILPITEELGGRHTISARYESSSPQLTDATSTPVSIFIPRTEEARREHYAAARDLTFTEFSVPSTGLGPVIDILSGLTLLGLVVLVGHGLARSRGRMTVQAFRDMVGFRPMTRFRPATLEEKLAADPRTAFPPSADELGGRYEPGPVFDAFVEALRHFEDDLPDGITHRELAYKLAREGLERSEIEQAAIVYERAQYVPGTDEDADVNLVLQSLETLWATYVGTNVEEPPGGRWWPFAPSNGT